MSLLAEELLGKAREFIDSFLAEGQRGSRAIIAYHGDGDGCGAAYFLSRYLKRDISFYWVSTAAFDFKDAESFLMDQDPDMVIFLDMPVYNRPEMLYKIRSKGKVFIYDHHYPGICEMGNNDPGLLYINPVVHQQGTSYPSALFGWELLAERTPFDREMLFMSLFTETWVGRVPLFGDFGPNHMDLLKDLARLIHSSFLIRDMGTTHYALNFLSKVRPEGIRESGAYTHTREYQILRNIYQLVQNEKGWVSRQLSKEIRKIVNPIFILKGIESQIRLCGLIASELRWQYPGLVVGIWQRWGRRYLCELRRGASCHINLVSLIDHIRSGAQLITGGGHPAAAAFTAEGKHFFAALKELRDFLREKKNRD
ncbi:MAG: hypothetical protein JRH06_05540 [Deltaproteobacteria bacterium]|nr:hypothetical protein [Deltaproteobacteria bacterium]MBW2137001.1 hypothetical protein [Deltaproteobacteria bacterium]